MNNVDGRPWGADSLILKLPALSISFTGLSSDQCAFLKQSYKNFLPEPDQPETGNVICNIIRLDAAPGISIDELTTDEQYAPIKFREDQSGSFKVTGIDFETKFNLNSSTYTSSLGVFNEQDLAQAPVIENYLRILSAHWVLRQRGVILHSAGLVFDGQAYIFSGRSNAGKTTLTRKAHKKGARVLSDDINLLLPGENGYDAYAVPFTGEFGRTLDHVDDHKSYPVAGVVLLEQSDRLEAEPVGPAAAVARLLTGCPFVNTDKEESAALFDSVTGLVEQVPVIRLLSRRDDDIEEIMKVVKTEIANYADSNITRAI